MKKTLLILLGLCLVGYFAPAVQGARPFAPGQAAAATSLAQPSAKAHKAAKAKHKRAKAKKKQIIHKRARKG